MFTHEDLDEKLRAAALKGHTSKLLELLEAGANFHVDKEGRNALHFAACCGHSDTVAAILLAGCDVNTPDFSGFTPIQRAAGEGHVDTVKQLIAHGAQVDHQDDVHGNTALHEATWKGYSHTVEVLARAKANAYVKNKGGFAPLHLTCQNGHNQSCRVLLLAGCRPDLKNNYGDTPLHTAARYGHAGVMRILISAKCNVNEQNKNGDTSLHIAAAMGRRKLTRILLESGCDQNILNKQGESAKDISTRKDFREVLSILSNPPPLRAHPDGGETPRPSQDTKQSNKKREKDSGTSKDSKDSGSHRKEKHKKSKHGHGGQKSRPADAAKKRAAGQDHTSPYGCHNFPDLQAFPAPNLDSLPKEPLLKGEQYYLDLAGNIRKGPVGKGYACYCAPFFQHVEQKLESDKHELMEHIDLAHDDLNEKIAHLERRTRSHLFQISQTVKEKLAAEKEECVQRVERRTVRDKLDLARRQDLQAGSIKTELKTWVSARLDDFERRHRTRDGAQHGLHCSDDEEDEDEDDDEEEEEEDDCGDDKRVYERHRTPSGDYAVGSPLPVAEAPLTKAKSEEMLSARRRAPLPPEAEAEVERATSSYLAVRAEPYMNGHAHRLVRSPLPRTAVSQLAYTNKDDSGYGTRILRLPPTSKIVMAAAASGAPGFEENLAARTDRWQRVESSWRGDAIRRYGAVEGRFLSVQERMAKLNEGLRVSAAIQDGSSLV